MAVYTHISAEDMASLLDRFGAGRLISAKGIAEGVENSNYLVETTSGRFILTVYEKRVDVGDLPFFLGLLDHLAAKGSPVPKTMHAADGAQLMEYQGKKLALIQFMPGVSVSHPTAGQARAVGAQLAQLHLNAGDFTVHRANALGPDGWRQLINDCGHGLAPIDPALPAVVAGAMAAVDAAWPAGLPRGIIHADLFPDNVLMDGDHVTSLIDFYFACDDLLAYDLAIAHAAWCFAANGTGFDAAISQALVAGYEAVRALSADERAALPLLAMGAALRFTLTRAYDWINTPADALVTRKDPMAFARRLMFYQSDAAKGIWA